MSPDHPAAPGEGGTPGREMHSDVHRSDAGAAPGADAGRPERVRVRSTDPLPDAGSPGGEGVGGRGGPPSGTTAGRPDAPSDAATYYTRGLVRAQLRLALACVVSFLVVVALLTVTMSGVPALDAVVLLGVPLPWLVHAYGFYPVIIAFAVVFAVAAARNERRFRALVEEADDA